MKQKFNLFFGKPFIRNVLIIVTGTAAAQGIYLVFSPIITRLYGPEAYGVMGIFTSLVGIVAPIAALTYPISIVLPKKEKVALAIIKLSLILSIIIAGILMVILLVFHNRVISILNIQSIEAFIFLVPLVVLFSGLLQIVENWLIRTKRFKITANATFFHALILQGSIVLMGLIEPLVSVLIIMTVFSPAIKAFMMMLFKKIANKKNNKSMHLEIDEVDEISIKKIAKEYKDFPIYRAPEVLLNAVSQSLPVLLLTVFFGPASAGFYTISRTVLGVPSQLIGKSVGDVFYPRLSEAKINGENLTRLINKATLSLGIIGLIPYMLIFLFGPSLFSFIFGSEWSTAGEYARWIALWSFFGFMNRPSVMALPVLNAQAFHLKYTILMLTTRVASLILGYYIFKSDILAVAIFSVTGAFLNIGLIIMTHFISKKHDNLTKN